MTKHNKSCENTSTKIVLTFDCQRKNSLQHLKEIFTTLPELASNIVSVIFYDSLNHEQNFQVEVEKIISFLQQKNCACLIKNDTRIMGRLKADGIHFEDIPEQTIIDYKDKNIIKGVGHIKDKHHAMVIGENMPDYLFFGRLGFDKNTNLHKKNAQLAEWWTQIMQIPAILQAAQTIETIQQALKIKTEFIAIESFLFDTPNPIKAATQLQKIWENRKKL